MAGDASLDGRRVAGRSQPGQSKGLMKGHVFSIYRSKRKDGMYCNVPILAQKGDLE